MDYDMFWGPVEAPDVEANKVCTPIVGRSTRVASYADVVSAVPGFVAPPEHQLKLYGGADAGVDRILSLLNLAPCYLNRVAKPSPLLHEHG